jgi:hypothetical protein
VIVRVLRAAAGVGLLLQVAVTEPATSAPQPVTRAVALAVAQPPLDDTLTIRAAPTPTPVPPPPVGTAPPVRLLIPALNVNAQVEALGVDRAGAMETPRNLWNVGWYRPGPVPGAQGDAVIDGHTGLPGSPLVFSGLSRLTVGADVIAVLADGTRNRFSVTSLRSWPANAHPAGLFSSDGAPRLSLITCIGSYDGTTQTYADRLIVETRYVGPA